MIFVPTPIPGCFVIELEPIEDERGSFARTWCEREFGARGLATRMVQASVSFNKQAGTLRGLHYQRSPHAEAKLVRCPRGAIWDVVVDLRPDSPAFLRHHAVTLSPDDRRMLYVPEGVAHGFQTLTDGTEVAYQMSYPHVPDAAAGVRWDDPAFGIAWPLPVTAIAARDRSYPDFERRDRDAA